MRVFSTSDLHVDYRPNLDWVMNLSRADYTGDVLIVAGDISDKLDRVEQCFRKLSGCFRQVLYVPGNHDLWIDRNGRATSLDKFNMLMDMSSAYNIMTKSCHVNGYDIVPLFGWYDFSFGPCCQYLQERWMDFYRCRWGEGFDHLEDYSQKQKAITDYFIAISENDLSRKSDKIISFSHFMPRIDLMPDYIPEIHRKLYPILGTVELERQIRLLGSSIHVYGHSHVNRNITIDGTRYINNAFGNPGEERITAKKLKCIVDI